MAMFAEIIWKKSPAVVCYSPPKTTEAMNMWWSRFLELSLGALVF